MRTSILLPLFLCLNFPFALQAAVLPVGNASFESPALAANAFTFDLGSSWFRNTGASNPAANSSFMERIPSFAAQGLNHLGMENGAVVLQLTPHVFQPNTVYTLTVAVGNRTGHTVAGNLSGYELSAGFAGLATYAQVDAGTAATAGQFVDAPAISLNTALQPALVGKAMILQLYAFGNGRSHFDNIRLETTSVLVTNNANGGPGSLRNAFINATSGDTILFDPTVFDGGPEDVIKLASDLAMGDGRSLTIDATNIPGGVTISGNNHRRKHCLMGRRARGLQHRQPVTATLHGHWKHRHQLLWGHRQTRCPHPDKQHHCTEYRLRRQRHQSRARHHFTGRP